MQRHAVARGFKLVVGSTRDHAGLEPPPRRRIDGAAERAWREHLRLDSRDRVRLDGHGAERAHRPLHAIRRHIAHDQLRTGIVQQPGEVEAHVPETLYGNRETVETAGAVTMPDGGPDSVQHAQCRHR